MAESTTLLVDDNVNYEKEISSFQDKNTCNSLSQEALRLKVLEEEQELLTSSLFSLTTHFAQVQFRLHQIVEAPPSEREVLLKSLEEFAFRGVKKVEFSSSDNEVNEDSSQMSSAENKLLREQELINLLKSELQEVENYAYSTGSAGIPQSVLIERQKIIIEINKFKLDELDQSTLSPEELRQQVDCAIGQLVGPLKMKDALVNQLKTQIQDLERFIKFLQEGPYAKWDDAKFKNSKRLQTVNTDQKAVALLNSRNDQHNNRGNEGKIQSSTSGIMKKAAEFIQIFTSNQFACDTYQFSDNKLKKNKHNHWGDHRAQLEVAVEKIILLLNQNRADDNHAGNKDILKADEGMDKFDIRVTTVVRKQLAICLRNLMQHGLMPAVQQTSVVPFFGCFSLRSQVVPKFMHAWELVLKYYHLKNGDLYNATPARCLSQSFNLSIVVGNTKSSKLGLLGAVSGIIADHSPYKSSYDSQFKAFVCAALNANKLVPWLKLILQCKQLINMHYAPWSYVVKTGM
ncbi:RUN domain-containing protein 1-like [Ctenocephalides felis]|uniref:RUN domain-containing protein 1-like n=1 Tax=Ctenocephalides felis TaxID=7515 RepID=UPI000E6E40FE|nr:RUN domain-containing protein 1-like [Ctenocephalides felis]